MVQQLRALLLLPLLMVLLLLIVHNSDAKYYNTDDNEADECNVPRSCSAQGYALDSVTCRCEPMRCAPHRRLVHSAGRVFCAPNSIGLACPPCAARDDALEVKGCACVPVRPCVGDGAQWWRDARGVFACRAPRGAVTSF